MDTAKPIKVKAEVMWCFHNKLNEMTNKYSVDLCNLSPGAIKAIESMGIEVRTRDDKPEKGNFITCKSSIPIKVFAADGEDLSNVAIGNGSKAVVLLSSYEWKYKNKSGVSPSIKKMVIEELQSYDSPEDDGEDDDDVL
jgi:hypothetical protein